MAKCKNCEYLLKYENVGYCPVSAKVMVKAIDDLSSNYNTEKVECPLELDEDKAPTRCMYCDMICPSGDEYICSLTESNVGGAGRNYDCPLIIRKGKKKE